VGDTTRLDELAERRFSRDVANKQQTGLGHSGPFYGRDRASRIAKITAKNTKMTRVSFATITIVRPRWGIRRCTQRQSYSPGLCVCRECGLLSQYPVANAERYYRMWM